MEERTGSFKAVKKKRGGFNAIDLLIIFLIVGVIVVFAVSRVVVSNDPGENIKLEYTVTVECVDSDFVQRIRTGERVYDSSTQNLLGTVSSVKGDTLYSVFEYDEESNIMASREYSDKYNVSITVSANANFVDGVGYNVGGNRIAVGQKMALRFPGCVANAYCVEMREVK